MEQFKQLIRQKPVLIAYFSYPSCSVCKVLRPKIEELASNYADVGFEYVDTQQRPEIAGQYTIFSVPTILIFVDGKEGKRLSRNFSVNEVRDFIERMLALMA